MISLCRKVPESIFPPPNRSRNENQTKIPLHDSTRLFETLIQHTYVLRTTNEEAEIRSPNCSLYLYARPTPSRTIASLVCNGTTVLLLLIRFSQLHFPFPLFWIYSKSPV